MTSQPRMLFCSLLVLLPGIGLAQQQFIINTVAGNGTQGYSADGVPATSSELNQPRGVAVDTAGNFYIADTLNNRIRKVDKNGNITTVAGLGPTGQALDTGGYNGDNMSATTAALNSPFRVAVDGQGNIYIADAENQRVRKVNTSGVITTVAGNGTAGYNGDNISAPTAELFDPEGVAVDAAGDLFIADGGNNLIRKVDTGGVITTVAGVPNKSGYNGDNIPATSALLSGPTNITVDAAGDLFIVDQGNQIVRKVTNGTISIVAGVQGTHGYNGEGIPAVSALLYSPSSVAVDSAGDLFIADVGNDLIREVSADGTISAVAGNGDAGFAGDTLLSTKSAVNEPRDVAFSSNGDVYIADTGNNRIRLLSPAVAITSVVNSASNATGAIAPGEIITIFGTLLGPSTLVVNGPNASGVYPTQLAGTSVSINGTAAPMVYASATQVAAVVPYEITGSSAQVTVAYQGATSSPATVAVAASNPALFTVGSGSGPAAVLNQDGTLNSAANPAKIGTIIVLYATGEGQTTPPGIDGQVTATGTVKPVLPVSFTVGGQTAGLLYAGEAPGEIAGVMQLNLTIPAGVQPGSAVPVVVQVGDASSPTGVTIAVSAP
jgi:uncharacterized protein (TIGR03437 family)